MSSDEMMFIRDFDLTGLNLLWKIALHSNSEVAQKLAIPYLLDLYGRVREFLERFNTLKLSHDLRKTQHKLTDQFLQNIMKQLSETLRSNYFEQYADRCLTILKVNINLYI